VESLSRESRCDFTAWVCLVAPLTYFYSLLNARCAHAVHSRPPDLLLQQTNASLAAQQSQIALLISDNSRITTTTTFTFSPSTHGSLASQALEQALLRSDRSEEQQHRRHRSAAFSRHQSSTTTFYQQRRPRTKRHPTTTRPPHVAANTRKSSRLASDVPPRTLQRAHAHRKSACHAEPERGIVNGSL
jgi:hypothetical protein